MQRHNAINDLKFFSKCKIADVYDSHEVVSDAILTLNPDFEYPDWSYKTVGEFLKSVGIKDLTPRIF